MNGYISHYRNGFDGQGLWVEVEVEKELGFKTKKKSKILASIILLMLVSNVLKNMPILLLNNQKY